MFSSLPSASKIYVNSCRPRQKNLSSAKKRRKKPVAITSTPAHVQDEETLVSTSSLRKNSCSEISVNGHEASLDVELTTMDEDNYSCSFEVNDNESYRSIESSFIENRSSMSVESCYVENKSPRSIESSFLENELPKSIESSLTEIKNNNSNNVENSSIPDNVVCDAEENILVHQDNNTGEENTADKLDISVDQLSEIQNEESNKATCDISENCISDDMPPPEFLAVCESEASVPLKQCEYSPVQISESNREIFNNTSNAVSIEDTNNCDDHLNPVSVVDTECQTDFSSNENHDTVSSEAAINCEKNEILSEIPHETQNKYRNSLGEDILKQTSDSVDSSSVRSDCCIATNIYDVHIDNSEQSSCDENEISHDIDGRIQSPEQSEVSCTESFICDVKNICPKKSYTDSITLHKKLLNNSHYCTDRQNNNPYEILSRSMSVPENISKSKCSRHLNAHVVPSEETFCNNISQISKVMLDKYTSTSEKSLFNTENLILPSDLTVTTSDKATITSQVVNQSPATKDMATTPVKVFNETSLTKNKCISTSFKDNTKLVLKVLPPVAVMQARARSYIFGSVGSTGSLLGNEELSRYFPESKVTIFVGTWNMNGHDPPQCIDDFLLPLDVSSVPDICAIGTQESMQSRSDWEILIQTTLGPSHVLFASTSFGVLHLSIFMRRDLIWFCSEPEEANIATRPGSMIKTKGAVAICFMFFGTSLLFINSHLTAHEQKLKERLSDIEKICAALDLPKLIPLKQHQRGKDVTSRFDCVFWCGDLNFRVVQDRPSVLSIVEEKMKKSEPSDNKLMKHDQLSQAMAKGLAFHGFSEGVINFIPSYKFDVGTSSFDSIKQRVPSYTDRILYRSRDESSVVCLHYNAVSEILTSDHKPVYAVFRVSLKPGRDNIPLAAGLFKRDIYLEAVKRRAQQLEVTRNRKQSAICNVM